MKKTKILLFLILSLCGLHQANGQKTVSVSGILGTSIPGDFLSYGVGIGLRGSVVQNNLYLALALTKHAGNEKSLNYGPVSSLGIRGGKQNYSFRPLFFTGDIGYQFGIGIGSLKTSFTPYFSLGLARLHMKSDGVYGSSKTTNGRFAFGGGFMYYIPVGDRLSLGLEYRIYPLNNGGSFDFGDKGNNDIDHGFSTSVFYNAFFSGITYRLQGGN